MLAVICIVSCLKETMNCSSPGQVTRFVFQTCPNGFEVLVVPCVVVHWARKLFGFPWDNTCEFGVNLSSLDKVLAYKTIEHLDESVPKDVAVGCNRPGLDLVRGGAKFWGLAQYSFQLVRDSSVSSACSSLRT